MSAEYPGMNLPFIAGQDLSTKQFLFMNLATDGQIDPCGNGADSIGVLQDKPNAAGLVASCMVSGVSQVIAGGVLDEGQRVTSDANGKAVATIAEDEYVLGVVYKPAGAENEIAEILLMIPGVKDLNQVA